METLPDTPDSAVPERSSTRPESPRENELPVAITAAPLDSCDVPELKSTSPLKPDSAAPDDTRILPEAPETVVPELSKISPDWPATRALADRIITLPEDDDPEPLKILTRPPDDTAESVFPACMNNMLPNPLEAAPTTTDTAPARPVVL